MHRIGQIAFTLVMFAASLAIAAETMPDPAVPVVKPNNRPALDAAYKRYQAGERDAAKAEYLRLLKDKDSDVGVRSSAISLLAHAALAEQGRDAAYAEIDKHPDPEITLAGRAVIKGMIARNAKDWPTVEHAADASQTSSVSLAHYFRMLAADAKGDTATTYAHARTALLAVGDCNGPVIALQIWAKLLKYQQCEIAQENGIQRFYETIQKIALAIPADPLWDDFRAKVRAKLADFR